MGVWYFFYLADGKKTEAPRVEQQRVNPSQKKSAEEKEFLLTEETLEIRSVSKIERCHIPKHLLPDWQRELEETLIYLDRESGEGIYQAYIEELKQNELLSDQNLQLNLDAISALNGESGYDYTDEHKYYDFVSNLARGHEFRLKLVLGEHLSLIEERKRDFYVCD